MTPTSDQGGSEPTSEGKARSVRRPRGEARRLLLQAAREVFAARGYAGSSTREIAQRARVSETLMFRYFGSKIGLFREALVSPFVEFVEDFNAKWRSGVNAQFDDEELSRQYLGDLFDLFRQNRGLVVMLWAADAQGGSELAEAGIFDETSELLRVLVDIGTAETAERQGRMLDRQDLATRSTLAMVSGMAVFGESFYGPDGPTREEIIDELTQAVLHGHLHRQ